MPITELTSPFDSNIDQLTRKIQEIRSRKGDRIKDTMDNAMDVIDQNKGRLEKAQAEMSLQGLSEELIAEGAAMHQLDAARVASLIADPFED